MNGEHVHLHAPGEVPPLAGPGVFETFAVRQGRPVARTRHLARLAAGAAVLGFAPPPSRELAAALDAALAASPGAGRARLLVVPLAAPGPSAARTATVVTVGPATPVAPAAHVAVVSVVRNERSPLAGVKSTAYADSALALAEARAAGADEAVVADTAGALCEAATSNVFVVLDGVVVTPPLAAGCLPGVVRALVLDAGLAVERDLRPDDLRGADEAFLTSSTRGVQPVASVDGRALPTSPGPRTVAIMSWYEALLAADLDP